MTGGKKAWDAFFKIEATLAFLLGVSGLTLGALIAAIWSAVKGHGWAAIPLSVVGLLSGLFLWDRSRRQRLRGGIKDRHIQNKRLRLCDIADDNGLIHDKVIEGCDLYGPAVLMIYRQDTSTFDSCEWMTTGPYQWAVATPNTDPAGSIRVRKTNFKRCRFFNVGVNTGPLPATTRDQ